jgi:hypothetical protein
VTELKRLTSSDMKKIKEKDKSENINDNKNENRNEVKHRNDSKNENENEYEYENILFLRVITASLCELLTSKYGHDILDGKIA